MGRTLFNGSILGTTMGAASGMTGTATLTSAPLRCENGDSVSIQAVWTGTPTGNFTVLASDDDGAPYDNPTITNWTTITGSTVATGGAAGNTRWNIAPIGAKWIQVSYTNASGVGTVSSLRASLKGAR